MDETLRHTQPLGVDRSGTTKSDVHVQNAAVDAVVRAVARIDPAEFGAYPGEWRNEVGTAFVDAVFSIRSRYTGVERRLRVLREQHPHVKNDLTALADLGERELRAIMGNTKTGRRYKAQCVMDAAGALLALDPGIVTADDVRRCDPEDIKRAYTQVPGLGWVTAEYFRMLLGADGVKSDRMVVRFVNAALAAEGLDPIQDPHEVRHVVLAAHEADSHGVGLTPYEHAVWRTKGTVPAPS